jgi:hypothetical protein
MATKQGPKVLRAKKDPISVSYTFSLMGHCPPGTGPRPNLQVQDAANGLH